MSVSGIGSTPQNLPQSQTAAHQPAVASDGDSAAAEASESAATKTAELTHGGIAPAAVTAPVRPGGVNKIV